MADDKYWCNCTRFCTETGVDWKPLGFTAWTRHAVNRVDPAAGKGRPGPGGRILPSHEELRRVKREAAEQGIALPTSSGPGKKRKMSDVVEEDADGSDDEVALAMVVKKPHLAPPASSSAPKVAPKVAGKQPVPPPKTPAVIRPVSTSSARSSDQGGTSSNRPALFRTKNSVVVAHKPDGGAGAAEKRVEGATDHTAKAPIGAGGGGAHAGLSHTFRFGKPTGLLAAGSTSTPPVAAAASASNRAHSQPPPLGTANTPSSSSPPPSQQPSINLATVSVQELLHAGNGPVQQLVMSEYELKAKLGAAELQYKIKLEELEKKVEFERTQKDMAVDITLKLASANHTRAVTTDYYSADPAFATFPALGGAELFGGATVGAGAPVGAAAAAVGGDDQSQVDWAEIIAKQFAANAGQELENGSGATAGAAAANASPEAAKEPQAGTSTEEGPSVFKPQSLFNVQAGTKALSNDTLAPPLSPSFSIIRLPSRLQSFQRSSSIMNNSRASPLSSVTGTSDAKDVFGRSG